MRSLFRGWFGEKAASLGMRLRLDKNIYRQIHNAIVPIGSGTTQIDHILVSTFGIFVVETKNMSGWIFGREQDKMWTQVFPCSRYRFQNPLRQNYRHTKCLAEFLRLDHSLFHSIAFFIGDCRFKTPMPGNVLSSGLSSYIKKFTRPQLDESQVEGIVQKLKRLKSNPELNRRNHLASLKARHSAVT